jgi:hypothetical protein
MLKNNLLILLLSISTAAFCQPKKINYGRNDSVGKFYDVRGIKMYTEAYGIGKPLLLIHAKSIG